MSHMNAPSRSSLRVSRGFTLIELLVVIAIIGVLSSVVLASLNVARERGAEASIRSNLRNMIPEAELGYTNTGDYSSVLNCQTAGTVLNKFVTAIAGVNGITRCWSYTATGDNYLRWGASARLNTNTLKVWSVDPQGVVKWDTANTGGSLSWSAATAACSAAGKRLPSFEQLKTLYDAYGATPTGFTAGSYWSSTENPTVTSEVYIVTMGNGATYSGDKGIGSYTRCVY